MIARFATLEVVKIKSVTPMHHLTIVVSSVTPAGGGWPLAVVATLTKGYDLEYIWKQVDRGLAKDAAGCYIQASESGGEPPGRWWGPGARALGFDLGRAVERQPYDLLFGERKAHDGTQLGRPPANGRKALERTYREREAVFAQTMADRADWETATRA